APAGAVAIRIALEPIHVVTKVEFRGTLGLSEGALRTRMTERFGATPPVIRAADVAASLEQLYYGHGYVTATVKPGAPIIEHDPDRATLVFDVNAGPHVAIERTTVTGQPLEPIVRVEQRLKIAAGSPYEPA